MSTPVNEMDFEAGNIIIVLIAILTGSSEVGAEVIDVAI